MARKTIDDCRCEVQRSWDKPSKYDVLQYNPRCEFHKGPDAGYGYDEWGRPNGKHSKTIGTVIAAVLIGALLLAAIGSVVQLLSRS